MTTAIANARLSVPAPARTARRFGLLSVAEVHDGGDTHWMLGGLTADGEECSKPLAGEIVCGPSDPKVSRSWYSELEADPWLAYMYETCKTVGRASESAARLRARFLAVEQSAAERGFQENVLTNAVSVGGAAGSVAQAIGALEAEAAEEYGGQIILHLPFIVAEEGASKGAFERVGDHLETVAGNLVSIGNYDPAADGGAAATPVLYATGAVVLHRSALVETGPTYGSLYTLPDNGGFSYTNDYYVLVERGYAALVDCFLAKATATL